MAWLGGGGRLAGGAARKAWPWAGGGEGRAVGGGAGGLAGGPPPSLPWLAWLAGAGEGAGALPLTLGAGRHTLCEG